MQGLVVPSLWVVKGGFRHRNSRKLGLAFVDDFGKLFELQLDDVFRLHAQTILEHLLVDFRERYDLEFI